MTHSFIKEHKFNLKIIFQLNRIKLKNVSCLLLSDTFFIKKHKFNLKNISNYSEGERYES